MSKLTDEQKALIVSMKAQGYSSRKIAQEVLGSSTKKSTVNDYLARVNSPHRGAPQDKGGPVIKIIDVETAP